LIRKYQLRSQNSFSAFTLVEVILVITVIGIIFAIFIPKVGDLVDNMRLKAARDKIKDDLRYIYSSAIARHDTTWFVVDVAQNRYGIYVGPSSTNRTLLLDPARNEASLLDLDDDYSGVVLTAANFGGSSEFYFDWWGTPHDEGLIVLNGTDTIFISGTGTIYETE